jgi:diacylglycerol kinase (ATP)
MRTELPQFCYPLSRQMRAAAILGLGCSPKNLKPFQIEQNVEWRTGLPGSPQGADVILLFGGDGTIHRHLGQLVPLGLPVLVVPSGSGNDFARARGFRSVRDAVISWRKFCDDANNTKRLDLGVIVPGAVDDAGAGATQYSVHGTRYFASVAGVGLDAEVARQANKIPRWLRGRGGYALTLIPTIFRFAPFPMKISTPAATESAGRSGTNPTEAMLQNDNWTLRSNQPTLLAAFANAPLYGGGMKIAPRAKMDDGLLDICIVGAVDPLKLFCMFPTVYFGRHLQIREVEYSQAVRVRIETEHPLDIYADGEFVCQTPAEIGVQREALRVVMP